MAEDVFANICTGDISAIYNVLEDNVNDTEKLYQIIKMITKTNNTAALSLLNIILSFGYIDNNFSDKTAERLDPIFGMNLLFDFAASGEEDVPQQTNFTEVNSFEAEIVYWFQDGNKFVGLDDIAGHFSTKSKAELKKILDNLCVKNVLYRVDAVCGDMYGLVDADIQIHKNE